MRYQLPLMTLVLALVLPVTGQTASFQGFRFGAGASASVLAVGGTFHDGQFVTQPSNGVGGGLGGLVDAGYLFPLGNDKLRFGLGLRQHLGGAGTEVFSDDYYQVIGITAVYGSIGIVVNDSNMLYGILEPGRAAVTISKDGYEDVHGSVGTVALGVGYLTSATDRSDIFIEARWRGYGDTTVEYVGGSLDGGSTSYAGAELSGTVGISFGF